MREAANFKVEARLTWCSSCNGPNWEHCEKKKGSDVLQRCLCVCVGGKNSQRVLEGMSFFHFERAVAKIKP